MAIAVDGTSLSAGTSGTTLSWTHTVNVANTLLVAHVGFNRSSGSWVGSYSGGALTNSNGTWGNTFGNAFGQQLTITNPATGLGTFTLNYKTSGSTPTNMFGAGVSYSGINTSTPIEGSAHGTSSANPVSITFTTSNNNDWLIAMSYDNPPTAQGTFQPISPSIVDVFGTVSDKQITVLHNGPISPAGAGTISGTDTSTGNPETVNMLLAIEVAAATGVATTPYRTLMGVGL